MYSSLLGNGKHKKAGVDKNVVATLSHNVYKDVLLNNKYLRHSMNGVQSKDNRNQQKFDFLLWLENLYSKH